MLFILIFLRLKVSTKKVIILSSAVFLLSIGIDYLSEYTGNVNTVRWLAGKLIRVSIGSGRILRGLFYLLFGCFLAQKQPNSVVSWTMLVSGYLLNIFVQNSYLSSFLVATSSIGFFCAINTIALPDSRVYPFVRKMSTVVYFVHMYIWSFYYMLRYEEKTYGIDSFFATAGICLAVSAAYTVAIKWNHKKR